MSDELEDDDTSPPTAREVAYRAVALKYVITRAHSQEPRAAFNAKMSSKSDRELAKLRREAERERDEFLKAVAPVREHFSPWERDFLKTTSFTMTARQQIDASWRVEAFQVLLWALGGIERLPPYDVTADHDIVESFPSRDFLASAEVLPEDIVEQARENAELWHWRSRTRELIEEGRDFPEAIKTAELGSYDDVVRSIARSPSGVDGIEFVDEDFCAFGKPYRSLSGDEWSTVRSITTERHFALNWLCGYAPDNEWDETPTDT